MAKQSFGATESPIKDFPSSNVPFSSKDIIKIAIDTMPIKPISVQSKPIIMLSQTFFNSIIFNEMHKLLIWAMLNN